MKSPVIIALSMLLFFSCSKISVINENSGSLSTGVASAGTLPGDDPLIGYATVSGTVTGGAGGTVDTVTTLTAFTTAATSVGAKIIYVSGNITSAANPSPIVYVKSDKSIIGLAGSSLNGVALFMYGSDVSNVIIQNMTMTKSRTYANIKIKEGAHHIWIDHNDLSADRDNGWEYYDGLCDVTNESNYVTISWNRFHDSHIPMLIGSGYASTSDIGKLKVTVHHNYFYNVSERTPDAKFGTVHVFNNYFKDNGGYIGAFMGAILRVENNYFDNVSVPIRTDLSESAGYANSAGYIAALSTNYFSPSCGANRIKANHDTSTWTPPYSYSSYLTTAAQAQIDVLAGAGVFATGVTSPSITTQPVSSALVSMGTTATLTVAATGGGSLTYQWKKNGTNISGATSATYTKTNMQQADAGSYTVVVTNSAGSVTSSAAVVIINLLQNNGFENDLTSWTQAYGTNPIINTNLSHVHSGLKSLVSSGAGEGRGQYITSGFTTGSNYTVSLWGKVSTTSGPTIEIEIQFFNSVGTRISSVVGANPNSTTFAKSSFSNNIPFGTTSILILVWNNGSKTFYSDDWSYIKD